MHGQYLVLLSTVSSFFQSHTIRIRIRNEAGTENKKQETGNRKQEQEPALLQLL
jgi:hypothetical protein